MFCECGCGKRTAVATRNDTRKSWIKGEYHRFVTGHRLTKNHYKGIDKWAEARQNKYLCKCGCGRFIKVQKHHYYERGIPKYIHGHHNTTPEFKAERRIYNKTHAGELSPRWVKDRSKVRTWRKNFLLSQKREIYVRDKGICQTCGAFTLWNVDKYDPLKANCDHVISVKDGGKTEVSNGQTLCYICHKFKHSAEANRMNSRNSRTDNLEPSVQSTKVQRLLEHSDMLNNQISVRPERDEIVQSR